MDESDYINDDNEEILKMMRTKKIKKPINIRRRREKNKNTNKMKDGKKKHIGYSKHKKCERKINYKTKMYIITKLRKKSQTKSVEFAKPTTTKHKCEYLWKKTKASK